MLVTSPPERNTTIRGSAKHCGNVPSGSSSSVQSVNKGGRSAWRAGSQGTEAESLVAHLLGPKRPFSEVTSCPALEEIIEGKGPALEVCHRKQRSDSPRHTLSHRSGSEWQAQGESDNSTTNCFVSAALSAEKSRVGNTSGRVTQSNLGGQARLRLEG